MSLGQKSPGIDASASSNKHLRERCQRRKGCPSQRQDNPSDSMLAELQVSARLKHPFLSPGRRKEEKRQREKNIYMFRFVWRLCHVIQRHFLQDPFNNDRNDISNSLHVAQFNESHTKFHVNVTGSEDGRLPQKLDTSPARAGNGVVVRKGWSLNKKYQRKSMFHH